MTRILRVLVLAFVLFMTALVVSPALVVEAVSREMLTAGRTYLVRGTDGNDADDCLSEATACRTWQGAMSKVALLDFGNQTVTIRHGAEGPYTFNNTTAISIPATVGGGDLRFQGQSTPGNTVVDSTAPWTFYIDRATASVDFKDLTIRAASSGGVGISIVNGAKASVEDGVIFGPAGFAHAFVHDRPSVLYNTGKHYTISGSAPFHIYVAAGSAYLESCTVTLVGTPNWAGGAFIASSGGFVQTNGNTFIGSATGQRYMVNYNGMLISGGGGPNVFPGTTPGSESTGGVYY